MEKSEYTDIQALSIVLVAGASLEKLQSCLDHLYKSVLEQQCEVIIVETIPNSDITAWLAEQSGMLTLFSHQPLHYAQACNKGLEMATHNHMIVLSDHVRVGKDSINNLCLVPSAGQYEKNVLVHVDVREQHSELSPIQPFDASMEFFLITKDVIETNGGFDEQFHTPRLMALDFLTRAHHNGIYAIPYTDPHSVKTTDTIHMLSDLLNADREAFHLKWNKQAEQQYMDLALFNIITSICPTEDKMRVLALGTSEPFHSEWLHHQHAVLSQIHDRANDKVQLESQIDPLHPYDMILVHDAVQQVDNIKEYFSQMSSYLKQDGQMIVTVSNAMEVANVDRLLKGNWSYQGENVDAPLTRSFTLDDIKHFVMDQGFDVIRTYGILGLSVHSDLTRTIMNAVDPQLKEQLVYRDYILILQQSKLSAVFEHIDPTTWYEQVASYPDHLLMDHIHYKQASERKFEFYNTLGVLFFENGEFERVLPYFQAALQMEPHNKELIFNISYFLISIGDYDTAIKYFADLRELDLDMFDHFMSLLYKELDDALQQVNDLPTVSIIVRTKNRRDLLERCLESINRQLYKQIEVVVINDGGEDVEDMLQQVNYPYQYERHEQSVGRAAALNKGILLASGTYINILDDDDLMYPNHVALLMSEVIFNQQRVVYSNALLRREFKQDDTWKTKAKSLRYAQDFDYELLRQANYIPVLTALFEKDLAVQIGGANEEYHVLEDWDFWIRLSDLSDFYHINEVTSEYSQRESSDNATQTDWHLFGDVRDKIYQQLNGSL
ncbi:glycosyltransferase [Paenibacillus kandeliae]|uniref:glycosyltransferase n=1 Tax=Paenibacillus kandeliae TaxID=3231269 RepID=UPI00345AF964